MKKPPITVHCVFDPAGAGLEEIALDTFRCWLRTRLSEPPAPAPNEKNFAGQKSGAAQ